MKYKYLIISVFLFVIGLYLGHKNIPNHIYHNYLKSNSNSNITPISETLDTTEFQKRIRINNLNDVNKLRKKLISIVWNSDTIPVNIKDITKYDNIELKHPFNKNDISTQERITVTTNQVINSHIDLYKPKRKMKMQAMIYHNGHGEDPKIEINCINRLLAEGYFVIRLHMPLKGENEIPYYNFPLMGKIKVENHQILNYFDKPYISYFTPVATAIEYVKMKYKVYTFHMMGISGGGWTTQLYAAMDTNITKSYSVAGSAPIEYRFYSPYDWGDSEQHDSRIYSQISYPEIYVLGSVGNNRSQLHILNQYDPCCFKADAGKYYKKAICEKINHLQSGEFIFLADSTEKAHTISKYSLEYIINHLNSNIKSHSYHECSDNIW